MLKRILFILLASCILFSISMAMPPHPDLLKKIQNGQIPEPIFMSNPGYRARMGIDQGLSEPLLAPSTALTNVKFLVIMVGFSDHPGLMPPAYFDSLVFGGGFGPWGPTLRNFYNRASYGNLTIVTVNYPSTLGWRTAPHGNYYYTAQGGDSSFGMGTYPNNSQGLCEWAVASVDPLVNFANYDNNGDGQVDGIILIHAGRGAEVSGDTLDIWSHEWNITPQTRDGVTISYYCIVPEIWYAAYDMTIGVYCHEFGHILGLPDLYDYGYDSFGLGSWSLMAFGSWNGNGWGMSPALLDAWSRVFLGFVTPTNVTCTISYAFIPSVEDSAKVYRLWTMGAIGPEYFLLECRSSVYTDTALAATGLTIYHIDETQPNNNSQWWPGQPPAPHYKVAIEQADNLFNLEHFTNSMDAGDPYPGSANNWYFNDYNLPTARDYYGNATNIGVQFQFPSPLGVVAMLDPGTWAPFPPYPPNIIEPDGGATNQVLQHFEWTFVDHYYYHFQLDSTGGDFSHPIFQDSMVSSEYYDYSLSGYPDGYFIWRVNARSYCEIGNWSNYGNFYLDRTPPVGSVASSPAHTDFTSFLITWTSGHDIPPSPEWWVASWSVYCDSGGGSPWAWQVDVHNLAATFTGAHDGKTYRFYALARDQAGNQEVWNGIYETSTHVGTGGPTCTYIVGDANNSNTFTGLDITYSVRFFKGGPPPSYTCECPTGSGNFWYVAGDVNGSCSFTGLDITYMVRYFKGGPGPIPCPSCPPVRR
jgi:immune inhibitor A